MTMGEDASALIELGVVGAPFGVRGWVKMHSFTDPPERLFDHPRVLLRVGQAWVAHRIEERGRSGGRLTAKLEGIHDRDAAQALRGARIGVPRSELPERDARDFYRTDLIGCDVVNLQGRLMGTVRHFVETPAQVLMVVRGARVAGGAPDGSGGAPEYWVPAIPQHLRRIDLRARRVVVDWDDVAQ